MAGEVFHHSFPLRFGDIDQAGILYYPRFHHHCHVAMEEWFLRVFGEHYARVLDAHDLGLPAVHLETDYFVPMAYGLDLEMLVTIARLGTSSVEWRYRAVSEGGAVLHAEAKVTTVCVSMRRFEKRALPDHLRELFERYRELESA